MSGRPPFAASAVFLLSAGFSVASLATRFPAFAESVHPTVHQLLVLAHVPLLLVVGVVETHVRDPEPSALPRWMQIPRGAWPAYGLGFAYLALVVLQDWGLELGPIDPIPPAAFPLQSQALYFGMFTVGFSFANYLAGASTIIPAIHLYTERARSWGLVAAVGGAVVFGFVLGFGLLGLLALEPLQQGLVGVQQVMQGNPWIVAAVVVVPALLSIRG